MCSNSANPEAYESTPQIMRPRRPTFSICFPNCTGTNAMHTFLFPRGFVWPHRSGDRGPTTVHWGGLPPCQPRGNVRATCVRAVRMQSLTDRVLRILAKT